MWYRINGAQYPGGSRGRTAPSQTVWCTPSVALKSKPRVPEQLRSSNKELGANRGILSFARVCSLRGTFTSVRNPPILDARRHRHIPVCPPPLPVRQITTGPAGTVFPPYRAGRIALTRPSLRRIRARESGEAVPLWTSFLRVICGARARRSAPATRCLQGDGPLRTPS